jgi:hypothetical protein
VFAELEKLSAPADPRRPSSAAGWPHGPPRLFERRNPEHASAISRSLDSVVMPATLLPEPSGPACGHRMGTNASGIEGLVRTGAHC